MTDGEDGAIAGHGRYRAELGAVGRRWAAAPQRSHYLKYAGTYFTSTRMTSTPYKSTIIYEEFLS